MINQLQATEETGDGFYCKENFKRLREIAVNSVGRLVNEVFKESLILISIKTRELCSIIQQQNPVFNNAPLFVTISISHTYREDDKWIYRAVVEDKYSVFEFKINQYQMLSILDMATEIVIQNLG
jgi:hypothetical protein